MAGIEISRLPGLADNTSGYNNTPFTQDNVVTVGAIQYAVWWDESRRPIIGKRHYPDGEWVAFDLSTVPGNPLASPVTRNGHKSIVMAVDAIGRIHVAGNQHNDPMRYVRSLRPHDITRWMAADSPGQGFPRITYPQFVKLSDGNLYISYREGVSGRGNNWLERWDDIANSWATDSNPATKIVDGVASKENGYLHHIAVGPDDSIHQAIVWRLSGNAMTGNDLSHIVSRDGGATWQAQDGTPLALPITHAGAPLVFGTAASGSGILNTCGMDVDGQGHPHIVTHIWNEDATASRILYSRWNGTAWVNTRMFEEWRYRMPLDVAVVNVEIARPSVLCTTTGRVLMIYRNNPDSGRVVRLRDITPGEPVRDAPIHGGDLYAFEPSYDTRAVRERNELHMLITAMRSPDHALPESGELEWTRQPIGILSIDLADVDAVLDGTVPVPDTI